ncbi:molecular chaperone [Erwiniaceae bacterium BAC15a-03b]|uniref:Molecular chaperone n=1 Tax=Winslowiella arboricola TaxID=2978220 RepID=A0A9J6PMU7_9GAMM|nr:molecular chaperone [Winslowiella arboricola]MCU5774488.1 molecular chaperone [Winslowiella arboricola]MCU5778102.1 molecular chaperone [Winslowiella arboricola]
MNIARAALLLLATLFATVAHAGNSVLIWPIDPKIVGDEKATELWLENRGTSTTLMQVRVFGWQQINGQEQYQTQQQLVASPPLVRIEPGQKQLVRLIKQTAPPVGQEVAYRVLLDEIPTPQQEGENQAGLNFQMRYSVPLFVYGTGLDANSAKPQLSWQIVNQQGKPFLEMTNRGAGHARLSKVTLGGRNLSDGLLGYVLANSTWRWPLSFSAPASSELVAELNNKSWRSTGSR